MSTGLMKCHICHSRGEIPARHFNDSCQACAGTGVLQKLMSMQEICDLLRQQYETRVGLRHLMVGSLYPSILTREMQTIDGCYSLVDRHLNNR